MALANPTTTQNEGRSDYCIPSTFLLFFVVELHRWFSNPLLLSTPILPVPVLVASQHYQCTVQRNYCGCHQPSSCCCCCCCFTNEYSGTLTVGNARTLVTSLEILPKYSQTDQLVAISNDEMNNYKMQYLQCAHCASIKTEPHSYTIQLSCIYINN